MFEPVFESLRKATDSTIQMQQDIFKKWAGAWPGFAPAAEATPPPSPAPGPEVVSRFQKKWLELVGDLIKKQREVLEAQFSSGLRTIEESFRVMEAKDFEEVRARTKELWQKSFDALRQTAEAQMRNYQLAVSRCTELMMKEAAGAWAAS